MPTTVRLFLAINLNAAVRTAVYRESEPLREAINGGAWVDDRSEALGVLRERRPFQAHLTLGRMRRALDDAERAARVAASRAEHGPHDVEILSVDLMQSRLSARGPDYTVLARVPLAES